MELLKVLLEHMPMILPSVGIGAAVPLAVILILAFSPVRKKAPYSLIFQGFATFFVSLLLVAVLLLTVAQSLLSTISISTQAAGDRAVMIGGCLVLLIFYLVSELLKFFSYKGALKKEEKRFCGGLLFGCGFILAQNLLVMGLALSEAFTVAQALGFGVLMLICSIIYLLISEIGYQACKDGHPYVGGALASVYFALLAVMLVFASVVITYLFLAFALIFVLIMGYVLLPLPFKKGGER